MLPEGWLQVPSPFPQSCLGSFLISSFQSPSPFQLLPCTRRGCPSQPRTHRARSATNPLATSRDGDAVRALSPILPLERGFLLVSSKGCSSSGSSGTSRRHRARILPTLCLNPWKTPCLALQEPWLCCCPHVGDKGLSLQPRVAGRSWSGQLFPFRPPAPGIPHGLHKAGNVSNGLRLMALHPRLSLKILKGAWLGWNGSRSRSWQPAAPAAPRGRADGELGTGMALWYPGCTAQRNPRGRV